MLQLLDIALHRGQQSLFDGLTCNVHAGQKVGIVGRNGAGKSTLFQLLLGSLQPERGDVLVPSGWRVSHMAQQVEATERPALDFVIDGHAALRRLEREIAAAEAADDPMRLATLHTAYADLDGYAAEAQAAEILHGLGFSSEAFGKPYRAFSGGWRIRLNLAQALMRPADLLLLDEPTNHLDLDATLWLEGWLTRFRGTLLLIAHDREFLDQVADYILHVHDGRATTYRGNYSEFERQRAEALSHQQAAFARQQAERKHVQSFIDRFRAKASKAKQVQSRLKALERMEAVAPVYADSPYRIDFPTPPRMSTPLVTFDQVTIGYAGVPVIRGLNRSILPGARIGILGANGAGKSTLLKCLVGALEPLDGAVIRGAHSGIGYFAQHQLEILDPGLTVLQQLAAARPDAREQWQRDYLGGWGFSGELAERPCRVLSGGEKARLALALIAQSQPALLVLDEPTNHLDLDMREALSLALQDFAGALVLVSHDRSLLRRVVDELWLVDGGTVSTFGGDLDAYTTARTAASAPRATTHERRQARQQGAAARNREKPLRDRIRNLERDMEQVTAAIRGVESRLADPELYNALPPTELDALLAESGQLRKRLEALELDWLETQEALEALATDGPQPALAGRS
jgi:ATP-binding cassette subfamily F protein 3